MTRIFIFDRMENLGLIVRKPNPKDRLNRLIALTEKVKFLQDDYMKISRLQQWYEPALIMTIGHGWSPS
ncbi:MAG: hypothetical protein K2L82_14975 [Lachnospiraceae bacterium]|nr:hypothetical protein [Lachnospiraceae bacterium]